jgi:hypothetical protein
LREVGIDITHHNDNDDHDIDNESTIDDHTLDAALSDNDDTLPPRAGAGSAASGADGQHYHAQSIASIKQLNEAIDIDDSHASTTN